VYYAKHRVEREILCFAVKILSHFNCENLYLFFEPRLSAAGCLAAKTGRDEGGLLCVKD